MKNYLTNQVKKIKENLELRAMSGIAFLASLLPVSVYADDPFAKVDNLSNQGITKIQGISIAVFSLALVGTGLIYGFGGREIKAAIKKHWLSIAIAIVAVAAGPSFIEWFVNFIKG